MEYQKRSNHGDAEEPLTPVGRMCIRPEHNHVILCALGFSNTININAIKDDFANFVVAKVPRFSSLLVFDHFDGTECWKPTHVKIDDHIFIHDDDEHGSMLSSEDIINSYMSDLAMSSPLSLDKPLWELHVMPKHKCMIMKVHHALADGTSMMSMLWSMGRPRSDEFHDYGVGDLNGRIIDKKSDNDAKDNGKNESAFISMGRRLWQVMVNFLYNVVFGWHYIGRFLWVKDKLNVISGTEEVDLWPRKMATAMFSLADMKTIKKAIPNATIYDILYGMVWCGLTRYMNTRYPQAFEHGAQLTGMCPVNLREEPGLQDLSAMLSPGSMTAWGNKFSMILLPIIHYTKKYDLNPLAYVMKAKFVMDRKKRSLEARLTHQIGCIISKMFGSKFPSWVMLKLLRNTTFLLSNIVGPPEEISIGDNPVTFIRVTVSSNQPQAIIIHLVSYMGRADLQIHVAKEIFPDAKYLANCFQDSLRNMNIIAQGDANGLAK